MDTLKSATGLGDPKQQSGEEPLSGEQGKGTVGEPYDQGNSEGGFHLEESQLLIVHWEKNPGSTRW